MPAGLRSSKIITFDLDGLVGQMHHQVIAFGGQFVPVRTRACVAVFVPIGPEALGGPDYQRVAPHVELPAVKQQGLLQILLDQDVVGFSEFFSRLLL